MKTVGHGLVLVGARATRLRHKFMARYLAHCSENAGVRDIAFGDAKLLRHHALAREGKAVHLRLGRLRCGRFLRRQGPDLTSQ
jgi:hypothetical protein